MHKYGRRSIYVAAPYLAVLLNIHFQLERPRSTKKTQFTISECCQDDEATALFAVACSGNEQGSRGITASAQAGTARGIGQRKPQAASDF
jgi:hypothetical protein